MGFLWGNAYTFKGALKMSIHDIDMQAVPTCDNDCTVLGWSEYFAAGGPYDLHVSVPPNADLDGVIRVFCHDEQEMLTLNGWAFEFTSI